MCQMASRRNGHDGTLHLGRLQWQGKLRRIDGLSGQGIPFK